MWVCVQIHIPTMPSRRAYGKATEPIDQWLDSQGLYRKHTARDSSCLFRAVSEQVFYTQSCHAAVRRQCVDFMRKQKPLFEQCIDGSFDSYMLRMQSDKEWGGHLEMEAMSLLYRREMLVFKSTGKPPCTVTNNGFNESVLLCASSDSHYDSIYHKTYIEKAAFCQSLVYEILYKDVFKLKDINFAVEKMLHKPNRIRRDSYMNQNFVCSSGSVSLPPMGIPAKAARRMEWDYDMELELDVRELLAQGITPFPYKVAKALDPEIYRNIEFDIWSDVRREMKLGLLAGINNGELQVGVKCLVKLETDRTLHAHIQEMAPDKGPVVVFIEELGQKCTVPHELLEPLPPNQRLQWALPYRHHRQLTQLSARTSFLTLSDFGTKWKKSKVNRPRKLKDIMVPIVPQQQVQCLGDGLQQNASGNRYEQERHQCSTRLGFPAYSSDNMTFTNNASVQTTLEATEPSSEATADDSVATLQADSTSSQTAATLGKESQPSDMTRPSPLQFLAVSSYPGAMECGFTSATPTQLTPVSSYVVCNGGVSKPQQAKDGNGNMWLQPVNFMAQKSVQLNGSDLPLADMATLRFYYNLGHDFFHSSCMMWPNPVVQTSAAAQSQENAVSMPSLLPDSTVPAAEESYQSHPVPSAGGWQLQQPLPPAVRLHNDLQEGEHNAGQEYSLAGGQDAGGCKALMIPPPQPPPLPPQPPFLQSQQPSVLEPYNHPALVPCYSVDVDPVPFYTVSATPYSCMVHPPDIEMVPHPQQLQSAHMYTPHMAPLVYHQPPAPPLTHWVQSSETVAQFNVGM